MDLDQYKQIISEAIDGEIAAKHFYQEVAARVKDNYIKELFSNFAQEEARHEEILTNILNRQQVSTTYFDFQKDFKVAETIDMPAVNKDMDLKSAIGIAMKNEEIAMKKYTALADNCEDPELKKVFQDLAAMERGHKFKMEEYFVDVAYPEVW